MKKRGVVFLLLLCIVFGTALEGCKTNIDVSKDDKITVVSTIFPMYDFVREIGGDSVENILLLSPGMEAHSYEPTPQDIITIQNCDLFLYIGSENDAWVESILDSMGENAPDSMRMLDYVSTLTEEHVEGMEEEHGEDSDEPEIDEHVWTSPKKAMSMSETIASELMKLDESQSTTYENNCKAFIQKLAELDQKFANVVKEGKRKTLVFGDRFPIRYFVEEYGLSYFAAFPGCASDTQPSAATIAFLIDKMKEENIPVVFQIELSNGQMAESIAEATNTKVLTFQTCHNLTKDQYDSGATYLSLMEENVPALREALN